MNQFVDNHLAPLSVESPPTTSLSPDDIAALSKIIPLKLPSTNSSKPCALSPILCKLLFTSIEKFDSDTDLLKLIKCYVVKKDTSRKTSKADAHRVLDITPEVTELRDKCMEKLDLFHILVYLKLLLCIFESNHLQVESSLTKPSFMECPTVLSVQDFETFARIRREKQISDPLSIESSRALLMCGQGELNGTTVIAKSACVGWLTGLVVDTKGSYYLECRIDGDRRGKCRLGWIAEGTRLTSFEDLTGTSSWTIDEEGAYLPSEKQPIQIKPKREDDALDERRRGKAKGTRPLIPLNNRIRWQSGDTLGMLVDTDTLTLRFWCNGIEQFSSPYVCDKPLIPFFICEPGSILKFNIGHNKFAFPPKEFSPIKDCFRPSCLSIGSSDGASIIPGSLRWEIETLTSFTLELVVANNDSLPSGLLFTSGDCWLRYDCGVFYFGVGNDRLLSSISFPSSSGDRCRLSVTFSADSSTLNLYVNGQLADTSITGTPVVLCSPCTLGGDRSTWFAVYMVILWDREISHGTLSLSASRAASADGMLSWFVFDESKGKTVVSKCPKGSNATLSGAFEWSAVLESDVPLSLALAGDCRDHVSFASAFAAHDLIANQKDSHPILSVIADLCMYLIIASSRYLEALKYSDLSQIRRLCPKVQALLYPTFPTLMLINSCLLHLRRINLNLSAPFVAKLIGESLLSNLRCCLSVAIEQNNLALLGLQHSRRPTVEFKNSGFVNALLLNVLHFLSDTTCSATAAELITSGLDIFFPFLSDQLHLLTTLLKIRSDSFSTGEDINELCLVLRGCTPTAMDSLLAAICRELSGHKKALRIIKGTRRPLVSYPAPTTCDSSYINRTGDSIIPEIHDMVSLNDPLKHGHKSSEEDRMGVVIEISPAKDAVRVLWKNGCMRFYPLVELTFHRKIISLEEGAFVDLSDVGAPISLDEVQRSLTFGVGEHSKESVLDYLRINSSKEFKFKYKLNRPLSALKAMYSVKEVLVLYRNFVDSDIDSEKDGVRALSPVFKSSLNVSIDDLLRLLAVEAFERTSDESAHLLVTLMSILSGSVSNFEGTLRIPTIQELSLSSLQCTSGKQLEYSALEDTWVNVATTSDDAVERHQKLSNLRIDPKRAAEALTLSSEYRTACQTTHKSWKSCLCTASLSPNSGVYTWYVTVDSLGGHGKGMAMFGVAEIYANTESFLGSDGYGWGLTTNRETYHLGSQLPIDFPLKISAGMTICLTYNSYQGELYISSELDSSKQHKVFDGLEGKTVFPAFSLFTYGDKLTITHGYQATQSAGRPQLYLGIPNSTLFAAVEHILRSLSCRILISPDIFMNPVCYVIVPQVLSALIRYQSLLRHDLSPKDLLGLLYEIIQSLNQRSKDIHVQSPTKEGYFMRETISRIVCLAACFVGRVCAELIWTSDCPDSSIKLRSEMALFHESANDLILMNIEDVKYKWLFRVRMQSINPLYDKLLIDERLMLWTSQFSSVRSSSRTNGDFNGWWSIIKTMYVTAFHVLNLEEVLELMQVHIEGLTEENWERLRSHAPPLFLCTIWNIVENFLMSFQASVTPQIDADSVLKRTNFLWNFAPIPTDNVIFIRTVKEFLLDTSSSSSSGAQAVIALNQMKDRIANLKTFVFDTTPLYKISTSLLVNTETTLKKIVGLKTLRLMLSSLEDSSMARKALLLFQPQALRGVNCFQLHNSLGGYYQSDNSRRNHYTSGTYGSHPSNLAALKGSFVSFYEHLVEEFDPRNQQGDELFLILINAVAQVLHEEDHDMLAKVDVFRRLQEIINVEPGDEGDILQNKNRKIVRAALKTFFLLTFQVAHSHDTISASRGALRSRSGPVTFTKSVFEILYKLIISLTTTVKAQSPSAFLSLGFVVIKIEDSLSDNSVIIDDAAVLLLDLCRNPSCLHLLSTTSWLVTLFEFCVYSFVDTQLKVLQILQQIMPRVQVNLHDPMNDLNPLLLSCFGQHATFESSHEGLLEILMILCSRVYLCESNGSLIYSDSRLAGKETAVSRFIVAVAGETRALIRCLLNSSIFWRSTIEKIMTRCLRERGESWSKTMLIRQLVTFNILGGCNDGLFPGGLIKDSSSGKIFEIVDYQEGSDVIRVVADADGVPVESTISYSNAVVLEKHPLSVEGLSVDFIEELIAFFIASTAGSYIVIPHNVVNPITTAESWLVDTWHCSVLKSWCSLLRTRRDIRSRFCKKILETGSKTRIYDILFNALDSNVKKNNLGSTTDALIHGMRVGVMHKGRRGIFSGEISFQSEGNIDVGYFYGGRDSNVSRDFIYPLGDGLPEKIHRKVLNHAGGSDARIIEEYMESCVVRILNIGYSPFFSQQTKAESTPSMESPRPEFAKVECIDLTRVTSRSNWLRSVFGEGKQDIRSSADEGKIEQLIQMGFSRSWAQVALDLHGGDFESALTYILNNGSSLSSLPDDEEEALLETAAAEEFMRHIEEMQQDTGRLRNTDAMGSDAPKEYYYDDRRIHIVPLYASPSFASDRVGSLFPSDSLYVFEELMLGPREEWLKVRLSDYEDDYEATDSESPFAWVPKYIDNVEVIFPGCASDSHGNLADPPAELYLHDASYEVIGNEGVILRDGIDLTSRELRVIRFGVVIRCDKETINFDGTLRLHVVHPYVGWISKKRHLVKKLNSHQSESAPVSQATDEKRSELDLLLNVAEEWTFEAYSEERFRKENRYFDTAQGTQFRRNDCEKQLREGSSDQRLRLCGSDSSKSMKVELGSKNQEAVEDILCSCANTLNILYWREIMIWIFDESYVLMLLENLLSCLMVSATPMDVPQNIDMVLKFLLRICYNSSSSCYEVGDSLLSSYPFHVEFPSVESRMLSVFSELLKVKHSDAIHFFRCEFITALLNELARHIRLACSLSFVDHCWADDTSRLFVLERDVEFKPSVRFAEWISTLVFYCEDFAAMTTVFQVWLVALKGCNTSLKHIALLFLSNAINYLKMKSSSEPSYKMLLTKCIEQVPLRALLEETGKRIWTEQEDFPLFSRCVQAMLQFTTTVESFSSDSFFVDLSSKSLFKNVVLKFDSESSSLSFGGLRDLSGSWTVEFWIWRNPEDKLPAGPIVEEYGSELAKIKHTTNSSASSESYLHYPAEYLLSSNTGAIKLQAGGRVLSIDDDPEQLIDPVVDAALCVGISHSGSERAFNYALPTGEWVHLALSFIYKTNTTSLFVNGDLKDSVNFRISLPCSTLGSHEGSRSFIGEMAEMRIWSYARSASELKRDLNRNVEGYKGLLGLLRCGDDYVEDKSSSGLRCRPLHCSFKHSDTAPLMESVDVPAFTISELEDTEGLYGEPLGNSLGVIEATGVFFRNGFPDVADPFGASAKEVIKLCYRIEQENELRGYVEWCARGGTRCTISGKIIDKNIQFTTGASSAVIGSPSEVEWIDSLSFHGTICDDLIEGSVDIQALLPGLPALLPGQARFDRKQLCRHISMNNSGSCVTNEDPDGGYHICTVALQPYVLTDDFECLSRGSGCFWLDWFINFSGSENSVAFGLCDYEINSCGDVKPGSCLLYSSGFVYYGSDVFEAETFVGGDVISLAIDADEGRVTFYKNNRFVYECISVRDLDFFSGRFRPFVALSSMDDSVSLLNEKKGKTTITFPDSDLLCRKTLVANINEGAISGRGCLSFKDRPGYWLGRWDRGMQTGIHIWIDFDDNSKEVVLEAHEFIDGVDKRTLIDSEFRTCSEVVEWLALRPSVTSYVEDLRRSTCTNRSDPGGMTMMMEHSAAEYILEIVLESGATVRSGVDIDRSPEVRKLMHGDIVEAYSKVSTEENVQRFEICDGYISERLRDTNQALVAKTLRHLFRCKQRYKVMNNEGAKVLAGWQIDSQVLGTYECGSSVNAIEMRLVRHANKESKVFRLDPSSRISGWVLEEDLALLSSLLPNDLQVELERKTSIRSSRKHSKPLSVPSNLRTHTNGFMKLSTNDLFLLNGGHPDMIISQDFRTVALAAENTRALVLGSKGFSRGVHYW